MAKIFLTSDTHFNHKNSLRYCGRPFFTKEACDKAMIERWNSIIGPEDIVYHLGDVAMHTKPMQRIVPQLNGKKILIIGNHDLMYDYFIKTRGQKFVDRMFDEYRKAGFTEIHKSGLTLNIDMGDYPLNIRLSHFPTKNAEDNYHNDKHDLARPIDDGTLNICGHVHDNWLKRGNNINVGVDVFDFTPVALDHIIDMYFKAPKDLDAPFKFRRFIWTLYHKALFYICKPFKHLLK